MIPKLQRCGQNCVFFGNSPKKGPQSVLNLSHSAQLKCVAKFLLQLALGNATLLHRCAPLGPCSLRYGAGDGGIDPQASDDSDSRVILFC